MKFRESKLEDMEDIMKIMKQAQNYLKSENIDQWQNNYPNEDIIELDINNEYSYILEDDGDVLGTTALSFDGEPTYDTIHEGEWLTDYDYAVIHRIAVDTNIRGKGVGKEILNKVEKICLNKGVFSIRIDTHRKNKSMRSFLVKNGFKYCGIIYLSYGAERIAYEKEIGI